MEGFKLLYKEGITNFMLDLQKVFPNHPNINKVLSRKNTFNFDKHSLYYINIVKPCIVLLENRDDNIFQSPFYFIPMIDLSPLWVDANETNRVAIWKHLQSLYIIAERLNEAPKQVKNSGKPRKFNSSGQNDVLNKMMSQLNENPEQTKNTHNKLQSILNQKNNPLVKLANEISDNIIKQQQGGSMDEQDFLKKLMDPSANGGMNKLMGTIQKSFDSKLKSGEIDVKSMEQSAKHMAEQLKDVLPQGLNGLFNSHKD